MIDPDDFTPNKVGGNWNEPKTPYGKIKGRKIKKKKGKNSTIYPFNKVYESESGHVLEIDDTPGCERLHQFHRSGTFEEVHPNGDKVTKVVRDNYTSVLRDDYIHIDGNHNLTVDKGLKILVNADKNVSKEGYATNFDIEVGSGANVNIQINRGNCNVRLTNGDMNLLLNKGDVNIRQDAGNYNHLVVGDYNLEVAGHMHVVVGGDHVTEIGGSRDARIDGLFDHTFVTTGYKETQVPVGNLQYICLNKEEIIAGESKTQILIGRSTEIGGFDETTVKGLYTLQGLSVQLSGISGASVGSLSGGGMDVTSDGRVSIVCPNHYSITSPRISFTALNEMNLFSGEILNVGGVTVNHYSAGSMQISSALPLSLSSSTTILNTAPQIHLNGPPAIPAIPSSLGLTGTDIFRINVQTPPSRPIIYTPGATGYWKRTINGVTPLVLLNTSVELIRGQLLILDVAAKKSAGLQQKARGFISEFQCNSPCKVIEELEEATKEIMKPITDVMQGIATAAQDILTTMNSVIDEVVGTVENITNSIEDAAVRGIQELGEKLRNGIGENGLLTGIKGAIDQVTSFIGDIIKAIADIACAIVEKITEIIDKLMAKIAEVIDFIMQGILKVMEAIDKIMNAIQKILSDIINTITAIINAVFDELGKFIDGITGEIDGIFDNLLKPVDCGKALFDKIGTVSEIESLATQLANGEITEEEFIQKQEELQDRLDSDGDKEGIQGL